VGREDGSAWPAVGYKEYVASVTWNQDNEVYNIDAVAINQLSGNTTISENDGFYAPGFVISNAEFDIQTTFGQVVTNGEAIGSVSPMYSLVAQGTVNFGTNEVSANGFLNQSIRIVVFP
jgi:hypothetical protein